MAGHSQFKNIMHRKGRQDAQKSKLFSKLAREITVAAKLGQPDPAMNARLRAAIISARQENMSKDSIERAVKKAIGTEGENYDEIRYEGYGPGGVAVIVEALTDNRNRAASDIRWRSPLSVSTRSSAAATAAGSWRSTRNPSSPTLTISRVPAVLVATTGTPHAIASTRTLPKPS